MGGRSPTCGAPTKSDALPRRRLLGRPQGGILQKRMLCRCAACSVAHRVGSYKKRCFAATPLARSPTGWAPTKSDALPLLRLLGRPQGGLLQKAMLCRCAACSVAHRVGSYRGALTFVCRSPPCGRPLTT